MVSLAVSVTELENDGVVDTVAVNELVSLAVTDPEFEYEGVGDTVTVALTLGV